MKKLLICSVLGTLAASTVFAAAPTIKIGGLLDFQAATRSQTKKYGNDVDLITKNNRKLTFDNTAHLYVKAEGRADAGLIYGAVVRITPTASIDKLEQADKKNKKLERTYIYFEGDMGRFELGSNYSAGETMKVGAERIAAATGGISGDYEKYINPYMITRATDGVTPLTANFALTDQAQLETFIEQPNLFSDYEILLSSGPEKARKITYYTPRVSGFQFGLSYTPDSENRGFNSHVTNSGKILGSVLGKHKARKNELNGGIHYAYQMPNNVIVTGALTADYATGKLDSVTGSTPENRRNLTSYNAGLQIDLAGFSLAGSYGSWGKSLMSKSDVNYQTRGKSRYWTLGTAYSQGPAKVSLTYMNSKFDLNKKQTYALGGDYLIAPGFLPYAEVVRVKYKPYNAATVENTQRDQATVYMIGTELTF